VPALRAPPRGALGGDAPRVGKLDSWGGDAPSVGKLDTWGSEAPSVGKLGMGGPGALHSRGGEAVVASAGGGGGSSHELVGLIPLPELPSGAFHGDSP